MDSNAPMPMQVVVSPGVLMIEGWQYSFDTIVVLDVTSMDAAQSSRVDRVIVEIDVSTHEATIKMLLGQLTEDSLAVAPDLTRNESIYQVSLARVQGQASGTITSIEDDRYDESVCGIARLITKPGYVGEVKIFAGNTAPTGTLFCRGQAVNRSIYADLFNVIGTTFGAGDGSTTFNVPDLNYRVPVGYDSEDISFDALGKTGGSKFLQEHTHGLSKISFGAETGHKPTFTELTGTSEISETTDPAGDGDGGNMPPYIVVNYIIVY